MRDDALAHGILEVTQGRPQCRLLGQHLGAQAHRPHMGLACPACLEAKGVHDVRFVHHKRPIEAMEELMGAHRRRHKAECIAKDVEAVDDWASPNMHGPSCRRHAPAPASSSRRSLAARCWSKAWTSRAMTSGGASYMAVNSSTMAAAVCLPSQASHTRAADVVRA